MYVSIEVQYKYSTFVLESENVNNKWLNRKWNSVLQYTGLWSFIIFCIKSWIKKTIKIMIDFRQILVLGQVFILIHYVLHGKLSLWV